MGKREAAAIISLFVINANEETSVEEMLASEGWSLTEGPRTVSSGSIHSMITYRVLSFEKQVDDEAPFVWLDLIYLHVTSNLPTCMNAMHYFSRLDDDLRLASASRDLKPAGRQPNRYAILYGCAGVIENFKSPKLGKAPASSAVGTACVVTEATWCENGEWVSDTTGGAPPLDLSLVKVDRLDTFNVTARRGLIDGAKHVCASLGSRKALCFDKVVKLLPDWAVGEGELASSRARQLDHPGRSDVRRWLAAHEGCIVDMESFAFLSCVPEGTEALVVRVLTDNLGNKDGGSADAGPGGDAGGWDGGAGKGESGDDRQLRLLREHAETTLKTIVEYVRETAVQLATDPVSASEYGTPDPSFLRGKVRDAMHKLAESAYRAAADSNDERLRIGQAYMLAEQMSRELGTLCAQVRVAVSNSPDDELLAVARDVIETAELGYSTARLREYTVEGAWGEEDGDLAKGWQRFCSRIDPVSDTWTRNYAASVRKAIERILHELASDDEGAAKRVFVRKLTGEKAGADGAAHVYRAEFYGAGQKKRDEADVIVCSEAVCPPGLARSGATPYVSWSGFQDDEGLEKTVRDVLTARGMLA